MAETSRTMRGSMAASTVVALSMTLMATSELSSNEVAWYTFAKLPRPSTRPSLYFSSMIEPLPPDLVALVILVAEEGGGGDLLWSMPLSPVVGGVVGECVCH